MPSMITKHLTPGPMSNELVKDRDGYQRALAAGRRAVEKSNDRGRPYVAYWIARLEFGIGYIDCIEAARQLADAKSALELAQGEGNEEVIAVRRRAAVTRAQVALQIARDMLDDLASVARNRSDVGAIAVMNEYVFRRLQEQLAQLQE